ncbi:MAG: TVP38/TMEM64 family protein [Spirochaetaceae bacterium]|nr:TVP38/TMEM64 family protein [Myxococcales bacterium]MCB9726531.1 TVP38/TMEM64 family protein [Spirochaetaceae bacterium]HPG24717.1 VTT domain-containing protein [Myxococcota bacterium]
MPPLLRRLLVALAILAVVVVIGGRIRESLGIALDVDSVRRFAQELGPTAPLLFVLVVAGRALLWLPSQVVLIAAGLCFGTIVGALVGGAGLMLSGLFLFGTARYAGREAIDARLGEKARRVLDFAARRSGAAAFGVACGYPLSPLSPLQAAAGWTPMPVVNFVAASLLGGMTRSAIFAYFGDALTQASPSALVAPTGLFLGVLTLPLWTASGRAWLRGIFAPPPVDVAPPTE